MRLVRAKAECRAAEAAAMAALGVRDALALTERELAAPTLSAAEQLSSETHASGGLGAAEQDSQGVDDGR